MKNGTNTKFKKISTDHPKNESFQKWYNLVTMGTEGDIEDYLMKVLRIEASEIDEVIIRLNTN